jgi:hypothetical protein
MFHKCLDSPRRATALPVIFFHSLFPHRLTRLGLLGDQSDTLLCLIASQRQINGLVQNYLLPLLADDELQKLS